MRSTWAILLGFVMLAIVMFFALYESKEVPAYSPNATYTDNIEPFGISAFLDVLRLKYGHDKVKYSSLLNVKDIPSDQRVAVLIMNDDFVLDLEDYDEVLDSLYQNVSFLGLFANNLTIRTDSFELKNMSNFSFNNKLSYADTSKKDLAFNIQNIGLDTGYYRTSFGFSNITPEGFEAEPILLFGDDIITGRTELYGFDILWSTAPILLTNMGAKQEYYLQYVNTILRNVEADRIYVCHSMVTNQVTAQNPLRYIWKNPSLRFAFYVLLGLALLYVIFGSRRWIKPIPVIQPKQNTSLNHVETISRLYEVQNNNAHVVSRMEKDFLHKIWTRLYIPTDEPQYAELIAKKSGVDVETIKRVLYYFETIARENTCSDEQLIMLYKYLEHIDKKLNYGYNE